MNPVMVLLVGVGVLFIMVGFKGSQDNLLSAIANRDIGNPKFATDPTYTPPTMPVVTGGGGGGGDKLQR